MKSYDVVIIGASAAGLTAALTARRHYPEKSILVIRKHELVPIPCGIPYSFGLAEKPENNLIPVSKIMAANGIEGLVANVTEINRNSRTVSTENEETVSFDRLVIATGSRPIVPPIPGSDKKNVFPVEKDIPFLNTVVEKMDGSDSIVIVGCGFIGVEFAEECRRRRPDMKIYVVEMLRHCLQLVYDEDLCEQAEKTLEQQRVSLLLDEKVQEITGDEYVSGVNLASGKSIDADMVILGIGAFPDTELAEKAGLAMGPTEAIYVDRYMQTSDRYIFACGDNTEKVSFFDGKPSRYKLASIATMEARVAGANLFGITRVNMGVIGVYSTVLGDKAYAAAGLTHFQAEEKG
ncbi:MAG: FAD-dependent oxidoreductase [bacterium]